MIDSLHIEDLGVIEEADLAFGAGLTALTGETGAGKTMVLTSLGLLLGQRAESTVVRAGADRALVEGAFTVAPASRAAERAAEAGAELDEDLLLASRTVPATGRSRAHLGGRAVPSSVLGEVGAHLVSVHGQADQLRLRSPAAQRTALDLLGGSEHAARCRRYAQAYRACREAAARLEDWESRTSERAAETSRLRAWLEYLEDLAPSAGEDIALTQEAERLDHAEDLRRAAAIAIAALTGSEDGADEPETISLLAGAERALTQVSDLDPVLSELAARIRQLGILAADIAADLGDHLAGIDSDPARLAWVQDRRAELARACREIGGPATQIDSVDALMEWGRAAAARLEELDGPQDTAAILRQNLEQARAGLLSVGRELTGARQELAQRLSAEVTAELTGLQMTGARLVVDLEALPEPGPTGLESVALLLVAHPGAPALPLGKGASGGELSRIMLALEVVLADAAAGRGPGAGPETAPDGQPDGRGAADASGRGADERVPPHNRTLVFDEIDAGVGGRAAREIGRRLARLARSHQVVVVTHLAQVAAWADTHLVVHKETSADCAPPGKQAAITRTRTSVTAVTGKARERELARMLSGHEDSQAAVRHAAELLAEAAMAQSQT